MTKTRIALVALLALLLGAGTGFYVRPVRDSGVFGTTTGEIIVGSPGVYSRERLVNDRFQQATWLEQQLGSTDRQDWDVQGSVKSSSTDVTKLNADLELRGESARPPDHDGAIAGGTQDVAGDSKKPDAAEAAAASDANGPRGARSSPIDVFRDKLAFREEVRAAAVETQLDDRHDIAGNTLYRIKFSVTVVPEQDTSAWAVVYVELGEAPESEETGPTYAEIYRDWLEYYQDQLNSELHRLTDLGTKGWNSPDEFRSFSEHVATALGKRACPDGNAPCRDKASNDVAAGLQRAQDDAQDEWRRARAAECAAYAKAGMACQPEAQVARACNSISEPYACPWKLDPFKRLDAILNVYRRMSYAGKPESTWPTTTQFFRKTVAEYLIERLAKRSPSTLGALASAATADCEMGLCRISFSEQKGAVESFKRALGADQVFAYAVSPKEAVQRIGSLASSQRERDLLLHASIARGELSPGTLGAALDQDRRDGLLVDSVLRKPLVVGFAEPMGDVDSARQNIAAFGWVIGPKFEAGDSGPRFRHATIENDVSAIVSVPSWWKWAQIRVATCWVDERAVRQAGKLAGVEAYPDCKRHTTDGSARTHVIRLPGNVTEVARKLGLDVVRRPSVLTEFQFAGGTIVAGEPADVLIRGNHLWRSTVVTLEGQAANSITVLPDMKGILAHFDRISRQWVGQGRNLWVFTSEGGAYAAQVSVAAGNAEEPVKHVTISAR